MKLKVCSFAYPQVTSASLGTHSNQHPQFLRILSTGM
jgi:hypothetical protein